MFFSTKEVYQFPQPASRGKALDKNIKSKTGGVDEQKKTSKIEGLNEEHSEGIAGAFEGFEDPTRE